jgi:hypothetical protein
MSEISQGSLRQISGRLKANREVASKTNNGAGIQLVLEGCTSCKNTK